MPNRGYIKGKAFEARVQKTLEEDGWFVLNRPRSKFPDLVAIKKADGGVGLSSVQLVEVKVQRKYFSPLERTEILELAAKIGAKPILAYRIPKPPWQLMFEPVLPKVSRPRRKRSEAPLETA